jgi:hypothetical protein
MQFNTLPSARSFNAMIELRIWMLHVLRPRHAGSMDEPLAPSV